MEVIHHCCCGLDVHKDTVVACVRRTGPDGSAARQVRTFATTTAGLLALGDWLGWAWLFGLGLVALVLLLFPTGALPSRRWWPTREQRLAHDLAGLGYRVIFVHSAA